VSSGTPSSGRAALNARACESGALFYSSIINHLWGIITCWLFLIGEVEMTTYTHPNATKVIVSTRLEWPNPGIPYCVLVIETNTPISEKIVGYDPAKLESLMDFVGETMEKVQAEKAEIYPLSEPDVGYLLARNLTASPPNAGSTA
jgi:hypothetical protein